MTHIGEWQRPRCALCAAPIEATARADDAPVFLRESRRWAHWTCWRRAKDARVEQERRRGDRGWRSVGQVLDEIVGDWEQRG